MDSSNELLKLSQPSARILHISLNRPQQLNALNHDLLLHLFNLLEEIKTDSKIKALLITGEGKAFCAGADIKELASLNGQTGLTFARFGQSVLNRLELLGKPSLAAIHGFAFGGGCELAMAATMRIASANTFFSQPEINLGVIPGFGGTQRLLRLIGKGRALDVCLTGRRFTAEEALQWGLITELTAAEDLTTRALAILNNLIKLSPLALQNIMTVIHQGYNLPLTDALELEAAYFSLSAGTADKREGVSAFLEKRTAIFNGE